MTNHNISFAERFIKWMEMDYVIKIGEIEKIANENKTTSADIMFKFLLLTFDEYLKGNDLLKDGGSICN